MLVDDKKRHGYITTVIVSRLVSPRAWTLASLYDNHMLGRSTRRLVMNRI